MIIEYLDGDIPNNLKVDGRDFYTLPEIKQREIIIETLKFVPLGENGEHRFLLGRVLSDIAIGFGTCTEYNEAKDCYHNELKIN